MKRPRGWEVDRVSVGRQEENDLVLSLRGWDVRVALVDSDAGKVDVLLVDRCPALHEELGNLHVAAGWSKQSIGSLGNPEFVEAAIVNDEVVHEP